MFGSDRNADPDRWRHRRRDPISSRPRPLVLAALRATSANPGVIAPASSVTTWSRVSASRVRMAAASREGSRVLAQPACVRGEAARPEGAPPRTTVPMRSVFTATGPRSRAN